MKRSLAYITAAWRGDPAVDMEQAAHYPQLSIREQMAAYKEVADRFPKTGERASPEQSHADR